MARLDQWEPQFDTDLSHHTVESVREDLRKFFWEWYDEHQFDVLAEINFLFWSKKIVVGDLRSLFVMLFGDR